MRKATILASIFVLVISGMAGGAIVSLFFQNNVYATTKPDAIVASSITVVDGAGKPRAGIGFEDGRPVFYMKDYNGKVRTYIALVDKGPQFVFRDAAGNAQLFIKSSDNGIASFGMVAKNARPRLMMAYSPDQGPTIGLFDENNVGKAVISVTHGNPSVALLDRDKKPAIAMLTKKGQGSLLGIWNSNNDPAVSLAVQGDKPGLFMYQQPRTGLLFNMAGGRPALALMDHGSPIWSATGDVPPAPELPPMDDMMRELTR